ncbi:MAG: uroporphyrinogen-III C-methyltransferase [Sulfuriferula sp.]
MSEQPQADDKPDFLDFLGRIRPALIVAILALGIAAWQWWDSNTRIHQLQTELAQRLAASSNVEQESRVLSKQAMETTRELSVKLGEIQGKLADSQNQQLALQALYQDLARSRDEWTLADIEQIVLSASQQLQLAGNAKAALIALRSAETRLQRLNKPQFAMLKHALADDILRLQEVPQIDTVGIAQRLDTLIAGVDDLPIASDHEIPVAQPHAGNPQQAGTANRFGREVWQELKGLVQVRRMDTPDIALLAPSQVYFLRQNLKLRLLTARIALLAHDEASYKSDLQAAQNWVKRYFNDSDTRVKKALLSLGKLTNSPVSIELPSLSESLSALQSSRIGSNK